MHRHQYQGRKLSRERDQRRALLRNLATSLIMNERPTTTLPKAKETVPYFERLVGKAKVGTLHSRRQLAAAVATDEATGKLVNELAPRFKDKTSGYVRLKKAGFRVGDHAPLATLELTVEPKKVKPAEAKPVAVEPSV